MPSLGSVECPGCKTMVEIDDYEKDCDACKTHFAAFHNRRDAQDCADLVHRSRHIENDPQVIQIGLGGHAFVAVYRKTNDWL